MYQQYQACQIFAVFELCLALISSYNGLREQGLLQLEKKRTASMAKKLAHVKDIEGRELQLQMALKKAKIVRELTA